jgi:ribosomal protein L11 methylase PrmA
MSWERGFFSMLAMKHGCRVFDLCCGGEFFAHYFFSTRAKSVVAVDFDPAAIAHAKKSFQAPNVEYRCVDNRRMQYE